MDSIDVSLRTSCDRFGHGMILSIFEALNQSHAVHVEQVAHGFFLKCHFKHSAKRTSTPSSISSPLSQCDVSVSPEVSPRATPDTAFNDGLSVSQQSAERSSLSMCSSAGTTRPTPPGVFDIFDSRAECACQTDRQDAPPRVAGTNSAHGRRHVGVVTSRQLRHSRGVQVAGSSPNQRGRLFAENEVKEAFEQSADALAKGFEERLRVALGQQAAMYEERENDLRLELNAEFAKETSLSKATIVRLSEEVSAIASRRRR